MKRPQFTIGRLMLAILVIAFNAGLIRSFSQGMFSGVILLFFAMQVGLFLGLRSHGRARRFWVGFEGAGIALILAMFCLESFPDSALSQCVSDSIGFAMDSVVESPHIPAACCHFSHVPPGCPLRGIVFPPEFAMAMLGGLFAMWLAPDCDTRTRARIVVGVVVRNLPTC